MSDWFDHNSDKLIILAILIAFSYSAIHGGQYAQHVVDWALGALGVLIVQKVQASLNPPPPK